MRGFSAQREFAREYSATEGRGNPPEKCRGRDEKISAQRMRAAWIELG